MNQLAQHWFEEKGWTPHHFQVECWEAINEGKSGLLNAPTGFGKTFAIWFGILDNFFQHHKITDRRKKKQLHSLWISPLRALSKEIHKATSEVSNDLGIDYEIALRTGDTSVSDRKKQKTAPPDAIISTPESVHILLANKGYEQYFSQLKVIVIDEWHELMGSKRGVLVELALSRLKAINPALIIWGISATIGNLPQAKKILLGKNNKGIMVQAHLEKKIKIETVLPDTLERFPWAGHLGLKLSDKVLQIIESNQSTLLFTNTRSQAELWYHHLLTIAPQLAGVMAIHHGSLSDELRIWVEDALHKGILKVVVCTSSLDLGVDFRPVDTVIQVGSPKGVARFVQRAGRSGHQPGAESKIYFVPTHSLEILEGASLKYAMKNSLMEDRLPYIRSFDVLIQYLTTLAVSDGLDAKKIFKEIKKTNCFESISEDEYYECLLMITQGGNSLDAYEEFHKVELVEGLYKVTDRKIATRHIMSIGAIVSDAMMQVKFMSGKYLGSIEESFISRLKPGDVFWFTGRSLELVAIKYMQAIVKPSKQKKGVFPSWMGGRLPITSILGNAIRHSLSEIQQRRSLQSDEIRFLMPLFNLQNEISYLPNENELLVEKITTKYGHHLFVYPFEGKFVHEGMAAVLAHRLSQLKPATFSIATNDYGFELLSDEAIEINAENISQLFSMNNLHSDIEKGINTSEMARRRFREIAGISGLVFQGYPGKKVKAKHLQANSGLFFKVFEEYESENLLLRQAYDEIFTFQLEIARMTAAFQRISKHKKVLQVIDRFSPFSFPIFTESFREKYSNEDWEARIAKIKQQLER